MSEDLLTTVAKLWESKQELEGGKLVFESLPNDVRPAWAASILESVIIRSGTDRAPFIEILRIARSPADWREAKPEFSKLRRRGLEFDQRGRTGELSDSDKLCSLMLGLAELVAKVTYNATNPNDEFDNDSGWYIGKSIMAWPNYFEDDAFRETAWNALTRDLPCKDGN